MEVRSLGNIYNDNWGTGLTGHVWDKEMLSPTLTTMQGGGRQPMIIDEAKELGFMDNGTQQIKVLTEQSIVAMRGRNPENPSDRTIGAPTEQRLEPNSQGICQYRIRKLTPRECYRLMAVPEKDIDKMLEVNSNTQCYKQAGNSIVVNCLIAIFSQMGIQGIPRWNDGLSEKYK